LSDFPEGEQVEESTNFIPLSLQNTKKFLLKFLSPKPHISPQSPSLNSRSSLSISSSDADVIDNNSKFCTMEDLIKTQRMVKAVVMRSAAYVGFAVFF
jgi:hypothetical protein